jgi:hypothetical protein
MLNALLDNLAIVAAGVPLLAALVCLSVRQSAVRSVEIGGVAAAWLPVIAIAVVHLLATAEPGGPRWGYSTDDAGGQGATVRCVRFLPVADDRMVPVFGADGIGTAGAVVAMLLLTATLLLRTGDGPARGDEAAATLVTASLAVAAMMSVHAGVLAAALLLQWLPLLATLAGRGARGRAIRVLAGLQLAVGGTLLIVGVAMVIARGGSLDLLTLYNQPRSAGLALLAAGLIVLACVFPAHALAGEWMSSLPRRAAGVFPAVLLCTLLATAARVLPGLRSGETGRADLIEWMLPTLLAVGMLWLSLASGGETTLRRRAVRLGLSQACLAVLVAIAPAPAGMRAATIAVAAVPVSTLLAVAVASAVERRAAGSLPGTPAPPTLRSLGSLALLASAGLPAMAVFPLVLLCLIAFIQAGDLHGNGWYCVGGATVLSSLLWMWSAVGSMRLLRQRGFGTPVVLEQSDLPLSPPGTPADDLSGPEAAGVLLLLIASLAFGVAPWLGIEPLVTPMLRAAPWAF